MEAYRVEFFYMGVAFDNREEVDSWRAERGLFPDLTATDYMENSDWELSPNDAVNGIIVTLFVNDKAVSSVWWHRGKDGDEFTTIF